MCRADSFQGVLKLRERRNYSLSYTAYLSIERSGRKGEGQGCSCSTQLGGGRHSRGGSQTHKESMIPSPKASLSSAASKQFCGFCAGKKRSLKSALVFCGYIRVWFKCLCAWVYMCLHVCMRAEARN